MALMKINAIKISLELKVLIILTMKEERPNFKIKNINHKLCSTKVVIDRKKLKKTKMSRMEVSSIIA